MNNYVTKHLITHIYVFFFDIYAFVQLMHKWHPNLTLVPFVAFFIGYTYGIKGYWIYDFEQHKLFVSRDVTFFENEFPFQHIPVSNKNLIFYVSINSYIWWWCHIQSPENNSAHSNRKSRNFPYRHYFVTWLNAIYQLNIVSYVLTNLPDWQNNLRFFMIFM